MKRLLLLVTVGMYCILMACGGNTAPPVNPTSVPVQATAQIPTLANPTGAPQATQVATNAPGSTDAPAATVTVSSAEPTQTTASTGSLPPPPSGDGYEFIRKATLAQLQSKSFRATTNTLNAGGTSTTLVLEYVAPDRIHLVSNGTTEQIAIKDKGAWVKSNGKWASLGDATAANMVFGLLDAKAIDELLKQIEVSSVKYVGAEILDGKPTFVYQYMTSFDTGGTQVLKSNSKVWIDALDQRIVKLEAINDSLVKPGEKDTLTVTYEYDLPLSIEPPI